jgi:hypothetical protein
LVNRVPVIQAGLLIGPPEPTLQFGTLGLVVNREWPIMPPPPPRTSPSPSAYRATVESDRVVDVISSSMLGGAVQVGQLDAAFARIPVRVKLLDALAFEMRITFTVLPFVLLAIAVSAVLYQEHKVSVQFLSS